MTFLSRDDVTSLSQAFCATVCVCSSGQGQARGESNTTDQCCGHHWERHKHSTDTTISARNGLAELKEDHLHRGFY